MQSVLDIQTFVEYLLPTVTTIFIFVALYVVYNFNEEKYK
jgi:hypothetical protein